MATLPGKGEAPQGQELEKVAPEKWCRVVSLTYFFQIFSGILVPQQDALVAYRNRVTETQRFK